MIYRRVEILKNGEWIEIDNERGLSFLSEGDQFKLYEPDGTLVGDSAFRATSSPYEQEGVYAIDAEPVSEQG